MTTQEKKRQAVIEIVKAILDIIRDSGSEGIPSGLLYLGICDLMPLDVYQTIILRLKQLNLITERHHVLYSLEG